MIAIDIYNEQGKSSEKFELTVDLLRKEENKKTFASAVRLCLQNWRQGTVGCKTRGELAFSNKKPWRQKGTGRARVSSIRSPLWRKGGVIFGPQARVHQLSANANQKRAVLNNIFYSKFDNQGLACLNIEFAGSKPSTKQAQKALQNAGLADKKVLLLLSFGDTLTFASFRNLPNVNILWFDEPNAYHLSNCDTWVFLKKDADSFKNMVARWN